ncbi:MAG: hypothetical protein U5K84_11840 [Alkalibacterium sp.]|nr:hypothetical protein [Alkalibacterium sp.]
MKMLSSASWKNVPVSAGVSSWTERCFQFQAVTQEMTVGIQIETFQLGDREIEILAVQFFRKLTVYPDRDI